MKRRWWSALWLASGCGAAPSPQLNSVSQLKCNQVQSGAITCVAAPSPQLNSVSQLKCNQVQSGAITCGAAPSPQLNSVSQIGRRPKR